MLRLMLARGTVAAAVTAVGVLAAACGGDTRRDSAGSGQVAPTAQGGTGGEAVDGSTGGGSATVEGGEGSGGSGGGDAGGAGQALGGDAGRDEGGASGDSGGSTGQTAVDASELVGHWFPCANLSCSELLRFRGYSGYRFAADGTCFVLRDTEPPTGYCIWDSCTYEFDGNLLEVLPPADLRDREYVVTVSGDVAILHPTNIATTLVRVPASSVDAACRLRGEECQANVECLSGACVDRICE